MFRATIVRLAESVSTQPLNLREASAALLPPLPYVLTLNVSILLATCMHVDYTAEYYERTETFPAR